MAAGISNVMFPLGNSIKNITTMKARFDVLGTQLSTGEKAANLAEMGTDRYFDLSMRSRIAQIDSYQDNIKTVNLRLSVLDTAVSRLDQIKTDARAQATSSANGASNLNLETAPTLATSRLDEVLTLMNTDIAGRFLFGGSSTETAPVPDSETIMNGAGGRAGFKQVASERQQADLGADHMGRTKITLAGDTVTLAEDGDIPFGLKLSNLSSSTASISTTGPSATAPKSLSVGFSDSSLPAPGDSITIGLTLPDGSEEQLVMHAVTGSDPLQPGDFVIGTDAASTASNFNSSLNSAVQSLAEGQLSVASTFAAADDFFNGQGEQAMRVDGPPFDTATALRPATSADTVLWYTGEDSDDPRHTVTAKVGDGTTVAYGVQANESGIVQLIRSQAAMSIQTFSGTDEQATVKYNAAVARNASRLASSTDDDSGSIEVVSVELGLAKTTASTMSDQHSSHSAVLGNMLQDIEEAPVEQVSAELLALQTRLQASYATTSILSQLSLVNYLK